MIRSTQRISCGPVSRSQFDWESFMKDAGSNPAGSQTIVLCWIFASLITKKCCIVDFCKNIFEIMVVDSMTFNKNNYIEMIVAIYVNMYDISWRRSSPLILLSLNMAETTERRSAAESSSMRLARSLRHARLADFQSTASAEKWQQASPTREKFLTHGSV